VCVAVAVSLGARPSPGEMTGRSRAEGRSAKCIPCCTGFGEWVHRDRRHRSRCPGVLPMTRDAVRTRVRSVYRGHLPACPLTMLSRDDVIGTRREPARVVLRDAPCKRAPASWEKSGDDDAGAERADRGRARLDSATSNHAGRPRGMLAAIVVRARRHRSHRQRAMRTLGARRLRAAGGTGFDARLLLARRAAEACRCTSRRVSCSSRAMDRTPPRRRSSGLSTMGRRRIRSAKPARTARSM